MRGRRRPLFLGAIARDGSPVGVPRDPAVAVPHEVALASLHTRRVLAKARLALERELVRRARLVGGGLVSADRLRDGESGAVALSHEAVEGHAAPGAVPPLDDGQACGARSFRRIVEELQDLAQLTHPPILHRLCCVCSRLRREETARRTTHTPMADLPELLATPPDGLGRCLLPAGKAGLRRPLVSPRPSGVPR